MSVTFRDAEAIANQCSAYADMKYADRDPMLLTAVLRGAAAIIDLQTTELLKVSAWLSRLEKLVGPLTEG